MLHIILILRRMKTNSDIINKSHIKTIVDLFYQKATHDKYIGHFFTEVVQLNFEKHMPIMYSFWDSVLFNTASYKGNPILKHIEIHKLEALDKSHFERWVFLWNQTVDELFVGEKAELIKQKAKMMKELMVFKIKLSDDSNHII